MTAERIIVHADMDAFYAAVEQLDNPVLRGKPVLVGPRSGRGVVLTASYEARPSGVGSAMPMAEALRRCPDAIVVPPRFDRYRSVSRSIMQAFREFSGRVEPLSLDEAFLDMSGAESFFGPPPELGRRLKAAIREATGGLTVTVGIANTKYVAKVASGWQKPDGLTIVPARAVREWLAQMPVSRLWGAGKQTVSKLEAAGYSLIGDVARADAATLSRLLGSTGEQFHRLSRGIDPREVIPDRPAKSISWERTLEQDIAAPEEILFHLRTAADRVAGRLRQGRKTAGGIRIKLKTSAFKLIGRQMPLPEPTQSGRLLYQCAEKMLPGLLPAAPFRLVGVSAFDLGDPRAETQLGLLADPSADRYASLERTIDQLEARFGEGVVRRGGQAIRTQDLGVDSDTLD